MTSPPCTEIQEVPIGAADRDVLLRWCQVLVGDPYGADHGAYEARITYHLDTLPGWLHQLACAFGDPTTSPGLVRLRGVPVPDNLPPTPTMPFHHLGSPDPAGPEPLVLALGALVGDVSPFAGFPGAYRVHNLYPMPDGAETRETSNVLAIDFHTERAFDPTGPDVIFLLCLRAGPVPAPPTHLCDLRGVWSRLDQADRDRLSEPCFSVPLDSDNGGSTLTNPEALVIEEDGRPRFRYSSFLIGRSDPHEAALGRFRNGLEQEAIAVTLAAGDLVMVDNTHVVHARDRQDPRYDGSDRWIQRCYIQRRPPRRPA